MESVGKNNDRDSGMSFQSPNYTQSPNDFYDMLPEMQESELRVTLVMIRNTFGFHRAGFKMGIKPLAKASGLSEQGARDGARLAETRGTFKRSNPDTKTEAEWELFIQDPQLLDLQPVEVEPPASRGQTSSQLTTVYPVKKVINKEERKVPKKKGDYLDLLLDTQAGSEKQLRIAEMYDRLDRAFKTTFNRTANTDVIVKFVIGREALGESLDAFVTWANRDEFSASRTWEYAEAPIKIKTRWQHAFSENAGYSGAIEGV
jgi:hypothetical protein